MSLSRVLLLPLSLLLGCAALTLPPNRPLARPVAFRGAYEEFPSGLRLVVHEDPRVARVTMNVSYRVGATNEPEGKDGPIAPVRRVPPPFPPEARSRAPMVVKHGPVEYPRLWLVWTLPGLYSGMTPQAFAAEGMLGVTYGVRVSRETAPRASILRVRAAVERSAAAGAVEQLLAELGTVEAELLPPEVVERARWQVAREYDLRFRTAAAVAERLLELERLGRPADSWELYPEAIAAVTPEAVQAVVRRLSLGAEVVVVLGDAAALRPQLESAGFQVQVLERTAPPTE
jgi:hypothetical protein